MVPGPCRSPTQPRGGRFRHQHLSAKVTLRLQKAAVDYRSNTTRPVKGTRLPPLGHFLQACRPGFATKSWGRERWTPTYGTPNLQDCKRALHSNYDQSCGFSSTEEASWPTLAIYAIPAWQILGALGFPTKKPKGTEEGLQQDFRVIMY